MLYLPIHVLACPYHYLKGLLLFNCFILREKITLEAFSDFSVSIHIYNTSSFFSIIYSRPGGPLTTTFVYITLGSVHIFALPFLSI